MIRAREGVFHEISKELTTRLTEENVDEQTKKWTIMAEPERIGPEEAHEKLKARTMLSGWTQRR